ncbi:MAG: 50S ribosomal protein L28 [Magnetococcales bacterium]|nr:50S ribosomal protein L28 [Magnetococcales bacterium]MBF0438754.1 50S ribosomal protein L28 [Magnetococcales bacterium]
MTRKLTLGGKAPQIGNNVSHSHRKTKHAWLPNIQKRSLFSLSLGKNFRMTLPTETIRSVDKVGGLDNYLLKACPDSLNPPMRRLQAQIQAHADRNPDNSDKA